MAGKRLATHVHVVDDKGAEHVLPAGSTVPSWARDRVTNPAAYADAAQPEAAEDEGQGDGETAGDGDQGGPPPKAGRGSSAEAWAAYAATHDVAVAPDASRDDIVAACEAAGVPTE